MKLFSKRHKNLQYDEIRRYRWTQLINIELRNRIAAEISFITSRNDFLEFFILFENQKKEKIFLDKDKVNGFSLAELWYQMSDFFEFENFAIKQFTEDSSIQRKLDDWTISKESRKVSYFDDNKLFDLIEFIILFSKKEFRNEIINRFNLILEEENSDFEIVNWMLTKKTWENLSTISNLLKDENLKRKLEDYEYFRKQNSYLNIAKIWAEIINILLSETDSKKKKSHIDNFIEKLANKIWITKKEELKTLITEYSKNLQTINNSVYNIRHTEKSTIHVLNWDNNIIYKFIAEQNISFVELFLVSLKEEFVFSENWEKIKENYISKYQIDKNVRYIIKKPVEEDYDDINIEDIPF